MHRITPVLLFRFVALIAVIVLAGCSDDGDDSATTIPADGTPTTEAIDLDDDAGTESTAEAAENGDDSATSTTEASVDESTTESTAAEEPADEVGLLCATYLETLAPSGFEAGVDSLAEILGQDAPAGVLDAIDTLQDPDNDIEAFFGARNSIDGYVLPICRDRFRSGIVPAADNAIAAADFIDALRDGDRPGAERIAPTNVVVQFDWVGYPEINASSDADNATMSMTLEPTVTVFCQLDGGAIEFCAFGE